MYKELIISIVVLSLILLIDFYSQKYTDNAVNEMVKDLRNFKENIYLSDISKEEKSNTIKNMNDNWLKKHEILAYYIEHDELEKIETELISLKSFMESDKYEFIDFELEKIIFLLEHINDKYSFSLENIF